MSFNHYAERQVPAAVDAILNAVSGAWRRRLEDLRADFDSRLAELRPTIGSETQSSLIARLVEELSSSAASEAAHAATRARCEAEQAAAVQLASGLAAAATQLNQERADKATLQRTIEELQAQIRDIITASEGRIDAVKAESAGALEESRHTQAALTAAVQAARQETAAAQRDMFERSARLEVSERRLQAIEAAHASVEQALAVSEAQHASDVSHNTAVSDALAAAQQATATARTEAEAYRAELSDANKQLETLREKLTSAAVDIPPLVRIRAALKSLTGLSSARDVLRAFIEAMEREFDHVALFAVNENRLEGWRGAGATGAGNLVIPLTIESPLTRAVSDVTSVVVDTGLDGPRTGLFGADAFCVMAFPIVLKDQVVGVAYGELARDLPEDGRTLRLQMGEILVDQLVRALSAPVATTTAAVDPEAQTIDDGDRAAPRSGGQASLSAEPSYPGLPRTTLRLRMSDPYEVLVDGGPSRLVDISTLGAQILCPRAMRPNQQVRLVLPHDGQQVLCQGQIVWARLELAAGAPCYRAGLRFTSVATEAIEAFMNEPYVSEQRTSA